MKKIILFIIIFFFFNISFSQEIIIKKFYIEIPNVDNIPNVITNKGFVTLEFSKKALTNLFNNYKILNFEYAFPGAKSPLLKTVYIIECDIKLIEAITNGYSSFFGRNEEINELQPLYIPNDLGGTSASPTMVQPELNFVRAIEAWDISKADNISIGVAEQVNVAHEDLMGKSINIIGGDPPSNSVGHGTEVAVVAAANTDTSPAIGIASIGFNANIKSGSGYSALIPIANSGARVINMSWGSCNSLPLESQYGQLIIDQVWESGVVLVAAAGNGGFSCPSIGPTGYHYPAALNHVIAVTAVGHRSEINSTTDGNRKDIFENFSFGTNSWGVFKTTYNDRVDLSAPGYDILTATSPIENGYAYNAGTSFSAPMVTGLIGLMFGANTCLFPDEVESILKLTAVKNDNLAQNSPYHDGIGAGRIDAFEAVAMAYEMSLPFGRVNIENRIIDRWDFNLRTAPFEIKMLNNSVTGISTMNFIARDNIEILSGDYNPTSTGFVDLKINPINNICNSPSQITYKVNDSIKIKTNINEFVKLYPNPNNGNFVLYFDKSMNSFDGKINIEIYDISGKLVYQEVSKKEVSSKSINVNMLSDGFYIVKITCGNYIDNIKFLKN